MIWATTTGARHGVHAVLIHGTLDRAAGLLKLSRRLDEQYLVTRFDRRGYGRSSPHDGPFDIASNVDDLAAVISNASGDSNAPRDRPRVLIGHSYGGNVALALTQRHPDLVDAVVTYETPLSWLPWWSGGSNDAGSDEWRDDPEGAAEGFMRRLIGDERWERLPPSTRRSRRAEGVAMVGELTDLRANAPWQPERIGAPVLAMHGADGREHHRRAAETIASQIPDGELVAVAGASHPGPNTHPDETASLIDDFVRRRVMQR